MPITSRQLASFCKNVKEKKEALTSTPPPVLPGALVLGPLEIALMVLIIVGMLSDPAQGGWQQDQARRSALAAETSSSSDPKKSPSSSSSRSKPSSSSKPTSSSFKDKEKPSEEPTIMTKSALLADQERLRASATKTEKGVRAKTKQTQYFLTMNGPGRPALVPFPRGFHAAADAPDGTLWWNNVENMNIKDTMIPATAPAKSSREERKEREASAHVQPAGTLSAEEIKERRPLEEEMERYEKVMVIMQCILALLLCFIDQRLGLSVLALFLFFYYRQEKEKETARAKNIAALPAGSKNPYEEEAGGL